MATGCSDSSHCSFNAGTYTTTLDSVLPGITLTLPGGWSSSENDQGELNLIPPGHPNDRLFFWKDMVAVKSSGLGHGTTELTSVGRTPDALTSWLTTNPDFLIVSPPATTTIGHGIKTSSLVVGVAPTAQYGDAGCPANPRCADFFTRPFLWGGNSYDIGGDEEVRLDIAAITIVGGAHTFFIALDGANSADLQTITTAAQPILDSLHLATGITVG